MRRPRLRLTVLLTLAMLASRPGLDAQTPAPDPHAAQPERPTVATHAGTVATGWLEIEAGAERDRYADGSHGESVPVVFKIGVAPRVQLSLQTPVVRPPGSLATGFGDMAVGVKWRVTEDAPVVGNFAILPSIKTPSGSTTTGAGTGTTDVNLLFISSHDLGSVAMDVNAGYTHRSRDGGTAPKNATVWTDAFGGPARGRLGWTGELYGYPATAGPAGARAIVAILAGPTLQVHDWLVVDAGVIGPITGPQPRAVYAGLVCNLGRLWGR